MPWLISLQTGHLPQTYSSLLNSRAQHPNQRSHRPRDSSYPSSSHPVLKLLATLYVHPQSPGRNFENSDPGARASVSGDIGIMGSSNRNQFVECCQREHFRPFENAGRALSTTTKAVCNIRSGTKIAGEHERASSTFIQGYTAQPSSCRKSSGDTCDVMAGSKLARPRRRG